MSLASGFDAILLWQQLMMADNPQFVQDLSTGKTNITDPTSVDAFNRINDLLKAGYIPPDELSGYDPTTNFKNGKLAMWDTLSFMQSSIDTDPDVSSMAFPSINSSVKTGSVQMYWGGAMNGFAVNSKSANIAASVKLAEFFAMQDAKYFTLISKYKCGLDSGIPLQNVPALDKLCQDNFDATTIKIANLYSLFSPALSTKWGAGFTSIFASVGTYSSTTFTNDVSADWKASFAPPVK